RADSGVLGQWSPPSVRAAIGPASGPASLLACVAVIALACHARAGSRCPERIVIVGLHRRVALLRLACFGLTPRQLPPIAAVLIKSVFLIRTVPLVVPRVPNTWLGVKRRKLSCGSPRDAGVTA